jgi:hypothetical protein
MSPLVGLVAAIAVAPAVYRGLSGSILHQLCGRNKGMGL